MARSKSPVEIASDLGAKAHDLYMHGDVQARAALRVIAKVNPETLAWLRDRLLDITAQRPIPPLESPQSADAVDPVLANSHEPSTREKDDL